MRADAHRSNSGGNADFDPMSREFANDPYTIYAALRLDPGFRYFADLDALLVARFEDINRIVLNPDMVRSKDRIFSRREIENQKRRDNMHDMPYHSRFVQFSLLESDGEIHDRLRKLVFRLFSPALVEKLRSMIQAYVDHLVDDLNDTEFDFIEGFSAPLPGHVIGQLIGVPDEDRAQLRIWSENIVQYFDAARNSDRKQLAESTTKEFYNYLSELKKRRRRDIRDDLMSQLIEAENKGLINEDEFISTCMLILMAGHGSTLDVLGTGLYSLIRFPDQMSLLRDNPNLIHSAIQEMFRFESPLPFFHRYATEDVAFNGQQYAAGTKFGLLYGSANRDPAQFANPDSFDISRTPNRHLAFGGGAHFCLGNHLARLNMEIVFSTLLRSFSRIELTSEEPVYKRGLSVRGLKNLHVSVERA